MRDRLVFARLAWALAAWAALVPPASARAERLPVRTYTTADGLPHDRINALFRDSRGFLWFGTSGAGLSRFDGVRFVTYPPTPDSPHHTITALLQDPDQTYWIATNGGGVYHFDPRRPPGAAAAARFDAVTVGAEPATMRVNALYRDQAGQLWAGTDAGAFVLDRRSSSFRAVPLDRIERREALQVWSFVEDVNRRLWIGTSDGLRLRNTHGEIARYPVRPQHGTDHVWSLLNYRDRIWIGHHTGVAAIGPPGSTGDAPGPIHWFDAADGVNAATGGTTVGRVTLFQTDDRHVVIGTPSDLIEFDGTSFLSYGKQEGLNGAPIRALAEDVDGNLWAGTQRGAIRIARHGLTTYAESDGLATAKVGRIFEARSGEICAITAGPYVNVFDGRRFRAIRPKLPAGAWDDSGLALQTRSGEWWLPIGDRLFRFPAVERLDDLAAVGPTDIYASAEGTPEGEIRKIFEDSRGDIWIATRGRRDHALSRWDRASARFRRYTERDGLPRLAAVEAFAEDGAGNVWLGFWDGGVARYRDGRFLVLSDDGPAEWGGSLVYIDRRGRLWASMRAGLRRIDDPTSERPRFIDVSLPLLGGEQPMPVGEDSQGALYLRITTGIARFDAEKGDVTRYTTADGLAQLEPSVSFRAPDDSIWFATGQGISRLRQGRAHKADAPAAAIGGLRIAGERYPLSAVGEASVGDVRLAADRRQIEIDFFAISFRVGELVRYQYKLDGADRDWSAPTEQRTVTYAQLSPGAYRFLVRAVNGFGPSAQPATVAFTVLAPLWRRPWFVALLLISAAAAVYGGFRYRVSRLVELERIRTRIATDLHDDIGAGLSQIAIVSEVVRRRAGPAAPTITDPLSQIAATARELVDGMGDIVWAIDPQKDHLASLAARMRRLGTEILSAKDIAFAFEIQEDDDRRIGAEARREVFLVFKEAITNIVRHADATDVRVELRHDRGTLVLVVADNGRGFAPTAASDGNGLRSMRARAARLGGGLDVRSAAGRGTIVTMTCRAAATPPLR